MKLNPNGENITTLLTLYNIWPVIKHEIQEAVIQKIEKNYY